MAELKLNLQPLEPRVAQGPESTFREAFGAQFENSAMEAGFNADNRLRSEINTEAWDALAPLVNDESGPLSASLRERLSFVSHEDFSENDLRLVAGELKGQGLEVPEAIDPDAYAQRRDAFMQDLQEQRAGNREVVNRANGFAGTAAAFTGAVAAEFTDPANLATFAIGAPAKAGFLATVGIEAALNAGIEGLQTGSRNEFLAMLDEEQTSLAQNMLTGAAFGGIGAGLIKGLQMGTPKAIRTVGSLFRRPEDQRIIADLMANDERADVRTVARQLREDADDADTATGGGRQTVEALNEHEQRVQAVTTAAARGEAADIPDRPLDAVPRASIISGEIEEIDPRDLVVDPRTFQFKSDADATGLTDKLRDVPEWRSERAGVVLVYESADGVRFVADGHQRTGLANRIMQSDPAQEIRLAAKVFREDDGFSAEDVRVIAALKNIAEAADGMTTAMARDAAKVLRIDPEAVQQLPAGSGIRRAQELTRLSDDAFALVINEVIPDNMAALVGRLVDDPAMHMPIMRLLERTSPSTEAQADAIIRQALATPVQREVTEDLFGTSEQVESLYLERAKVLERTMKILRDDDRTFRTLTKRGDTIEGRAGNKLDAEGNTQQRKQIEQAMAAIQKLAYRAGPISEALDNGAQNYKGNGRLADAARSVAAAIQRQIERDGLSGLGDGAGGRPAKPANEGAAAPDPNEGFSDPVNGSGVDAQIANTRIEADAARPDAEAIDPNTISGPDGKPVKLYHGTNKAFDQFQDGRIFLTNQRSLANEHALRQGVKGARTIEANVALERPLEIEVASGVEPDAHWLQNTIEIERQLDSGEFDGVMIYNAEGDLMVIATASSQVKQLAPESAAPFSRRAARTQETDGAEVEQTPAGSQMLIEGVRPITARERVQTAADRPLIAPTRTTDSEIGGMFDANDPARFDLFDQVPVGRREVDGELRAETVSRQELMDELDADDDFAEQLGFCLK